MTRPGDEEEHMDEDPLATDGRTAGRYRAIATFVTPPDGGPFWRIEFPDGLEELRIPGMEVPGICTTDGHTKDDARESAQWLAALAHDDSSPVTVDIEWRNESAYERWLARERTTPDRDRQGS